MWSGETYEVFLKNFRRCLFHVWGLSGAVDVIELDPEWQGAVFFMLSS